MSDFTSSLLTAMIQVTLVIVPAAFLICSIGRRCAAASGTIALSGIAVAAVVSVAAFAPLPSTWTWSHSTKSLESTSAVDSSTPVVPSTSPTLDVGQLLSMLRFSGTTQESAGWSWQCKIAICVLAVTAFSLTRFLAGLWAIDRLRQRSRPIVNCQLTALVDELSQSLNLTQSIELRSSATLGSAAACGLRWPTVLLAADWHSWDPADLRAVLAHELAHIRRRDYALGIVARICLTLCLHHPLGHWLTSRLRLAQEIAADELAALVAGGRTRYRQALARMALRQDSAWLGGMAQTFGTNRNSLSRRLAMLLVERNRPLGHAARVGLIGLVVAIGITVSAVRATAEPPAADAPPAALPAFELGYLPENCEGFVAFRPGQLFCRPEMKPICESLTTSLNGVLRVLGMPADRSIPLAEIEQLVGPVELKTLTDEERKKQPGGERHAFMMGINYIRMSRDFDWTGLLKSLPKSMRVVEKEPGLFEALLPVFGPNPITLRVLDARTIVGSSLTNEQSARRRIEVANRFGNRILSSADRSSLILALATNRELWSHAIEREPKMASVLEQLGPPARLAVSVPTPDSVSGQLTVEWNSPPNDFAKGQESLVAFVSESLRTSLPENAVDKKLQTLVADWLSSAKVHRDGNAVRVDVRSTVRWCDLFSAIVSNGNAKMEVKESKSGQ